MWKIIKIIIEKLSDYWTLYCWKYYYFLKVWYFSTPYPIIVLLLSIVGFLGFLYIGNYMIVSIIWDIVYQYNSVILHLIYKIFYDCVVWFFNSFTVICEVVLIKKRLNLFEILHLIFTNTDNMSIFKAHNATSKFLSMYYYYYNNISIRTYHICDYYMDTLDIKEQLEMQEKCEQMYIDFKRHCTLLSFSIICVFFFGMIIYKSL